MLGLVFGALSLRDAGRHGSSKTLGYVALALSLLNILLSSGLTITGNTPWQT